MSFGAARRYRWFALALQHAWRGIHAVVAARWLADAAPLPAGWFTFAFNWPLPFTFTFARIYYSLTATVTCTFTL